MTLLTTSLLVAQGLERPKVAREVICSVPVGMSVFFYLSHAKQDEYPILLSHILFMESQALDIKASIKRHIKFLPVRRFFG